MQSISDEADRHIACAWDVARVKNMKIMFSNADCFNQPVGAWDVAKVKNMKIMFGNAGSFIQPVGAWDVAKVKT